MNPTPGIGWSTPDGGQTWQPPPIPASQQNQQTLLLTRECSALVRLLLGALDTLNGI